MARQLIPLRKIDPSAHGIPFTPDMLDWVSFHREFNGAAKAGALIKCGGRVYVDPPKFLEWMSTIPRISPPVTRQKAKKTDAKRKRAPTRALTRVGESAKASAQ